MSPLNLLPRVSSQIGGKIFRQAWTCIRPIPDLVIADRSLNLRTSSANSKHSRLIRSNPHSRFAM